MKSKKVFKNYILPVMAITAIATVLMFLVQIQQSWVHKPAWVERVLSPLGALEAMELKTLDLRFVQRGGARVPGSQTGRPR